MPIGSTKDNQGNTTLYVAMGKGISTITKGMPVCLSLHEGYFVIQQRFSKNASVTLMCPQITNIREIFEKDIFAKSQIVGRSAKGDLSADTRSKTHNSNMHKSLKTKEYIIINYGSTSNKVIIFEKIIGTTIGSKEFIQEVKQRANLTSIDG